MGHIVPCLALIDFTDFMIIPIELKKSKSVLSSNMLIPPEVCKCKNGGTQLQQQLNTDLFYPRQTAKLDKK